VPAIAKTAMTVTTASGLIFTGDRFSLQAMR
jgi:hypothetical protein